VVIGGVPVAAVSVAGGGRGRGHGGWGASAGPVGAWALRCGGGRSRDGPRARGPARPQARRPVGP
jgi:hypothetical protein